MKLLIISLLFLTSFLTHSQIFGNSRDEVDNSTHDKQIRNEEKIAYLTSYEPNLIGLTYDNDDKTPFLDFKVSLKYPIAHEYSKDWCNNRLFSSCIPYFTFTGRFGQYIETRESSPVIGKRFNPSLMFKFNFQDGYVDNTLTYLTKKQYITLEYGHESNGQRVASLASWQAMADDFELNGEKSAFANDYISRGWDYWGITYKTSIIDKRINAYLHYQNFIGGLLQGDIEEFYPWEEQRSITSRKQINGLKVLLRYQNTNKNKFALIYETGIKNSFKYNTYKFEAATYFFDMPAMIWIRHGYAADFAQYFKKNTSYGFAFELSSFK